MKKFARTLLGAIALLPLLSHCASYSEVERLQNQLRTMNRRMEDLKSNQTDVSQLQQQVQDLQSQLDDSNLANTRLKEQNRSLEASLGARNKQESGKRDEAISKLEENLHAKDERIAALEEKLKVQQDDLKLIQAKKVSDTEKALKEAQTKAEAARAKAKALSATTSASAEVKKLTSGQTKIVNKATPAAATKPVDNDSFNRISPSTPPPAKTTAIKTPAAEPAVVAGDKLAEGKQLYAQKQYTKAQAAFEAYLASKPSASQAAEADYMIGECNYQSKQYDLAIINYQKVASKPTLGKAAAATLKQGMAFEQMADLEMARTIYKKLIDQHPNTAEAKTAQERLGKL